MLLAGLLADGPTTVVEPQPSRDHTERMLRAMGLQRSRATARASPSRPRRPSRCPTSIEPGDPSSAAFWIAAALLVPGSALRIDNVAANWTRTGFIEIARRMGARIAGELERPRAGDPSREPVTSLEVSHGPLVATTVGPDEVALAIDELPLVALLGCYAEGDTVVGGAAELRVKETDRIATVVEGLRALGAAIEPAEDGFVVHGTGEAARRRAPLPRRSPPGDAGRDRRARLSRWRDRRGHGRGRRVLPGVRRRSRGARGMIVAIDGPAGAGKSTVARGVAHALGFA